MYAFLITLNKMQRGRLMTAVKLFFVAWVGIGMTSFAQVTPGADPVPSLLRNLDAENAGVAAAAARSLGVVFAPGGRGGDQVAEVTHALVAALGSPKGPILRLHSARALGKMQAKAALPALKKAVTD
ncbi:MAG: hypothetical protein ACI8W8_004196, partial [Rhodothermales bacterium]